MLKTVTVKDFQSHKKTVIELGAGVNVIVGNSDSGKSAILRAIQWAIENKCDDSSFQRRGGGDTSVTLEFDDFTVERAREGKDNIYRLTVGEEEQVFKAFKTAIPEDIAHLLNMSEINIQNQLEAPFLLSQTSGEVAKILNRTVDLSVIHESISEIKRLSSQNKQSTDVVNQQIAEAQDSLEEFKLLDAFEEDIEVHEELIEAKETLTGKISSLHKLYREAQAAQSTLDSFSEVDDLEKKVDSVLELVKEKDKCLGNIKTLARLVIDAECNQKNSFKCNDLIKMADNVTNALTLYKHQTEIQDAIAIVRRYETAAEQLETRIAEMETEYIDNMPEECPLCGHNMLEE